MARSHASWTVALLRPVARDGQQERRILEGPDVLGVTRSEEEDLPVADLELLVAMVFVFLMPVSWLLRRGRLRHR